jgi:hypothetical protein
MLKGCRHQPIFLLRSTSEDELNRQQTHFGITTGIMTSIPLLSKFLPGCCRVPRPCATSSEQTSMAYPLALTVRGITRIRHEGNHLFHRAVSALYNMSPTCESRHQNSCHAALRNLYSGRPTLTSHCYIWYPASIPFGIFSISVRLGSQCSYLFHT